MEFVKEKEAINLLSDNGIAPVSGENDRVFLKMEQTDETVRFEITPPDYEGEPADGAQRLTIEANRIPDLIEGIIHRLHLNQVLLVPVCKWRNVFDAVAFSLASNEDWQEMDATATVELNARDPLVCEPGDFHTVNALVCALLNDAEGPDQGLMITSTAAPLLLELIPGGPVRLSFGNQVLADEVAEAFEHV